MTQYLDEREDAPHLTPRRLRRHPSDTVHLSSTDSAERPTPNLQQRSQAGAIESPNVQKYASAATETCDHRNDWPGSDWCALDIATTPEQTFHVLFKFIKNTEFHHASSSSSPRVLRKIIPASSDENRGPALLVNTELTLLTSLGGDCPKHHAWR